MNPYFHVVAKKRGEEGGGGPGGDVFASDTFTGSDGTDLTSHTGEVGATWAKVTGITGTIKITGNKSKGDSGVISLYYASGTPDTNEYDVEADLHVVSLTDLPGVGGRINAGADDGYYLYHHTDGEWRLVKRVAATDTSLGTYTDVLSAGNDRHIKLQIRDATKKAFIDGVERISSGNNDITATGKAGLRTANSDWGLGSTGKTLDTFVATNA